MFAGSSMESDRPTPAIHFVHALARAVDEQDRPEFQVLCDWWREMIPSGGKTGKRADRCQGGLCALIGIGGAGKTALIDRFLRGFSEARTPNPTESPPLLPPPRAAWVYSFYDEPNPDIFFIRLSDWLTSSFGKGKSKTTGAESDSVYNPETVVFECLRRGVDFQFRDSKESSPVEVDEKRAAAVQAPRPPLLLVLDGLEMVQEPGASDAPVTAVGRIDHTGLRSWIQTAARGGFAGVAVVVSSRLALPDLASTTRFPRVRVIRVGALPAEASVALLRSRGVTRGSEETLRRFVQECGGHALTLGLLGGYIGQFCEGAPDRLPDDPRERHERLARESIDSLHPEVLRIAAAERALAAVAERYRMALRSRQPAAHAVLLRLALFRVAVTANMMTCTLLAQSGGWEEGGRAGAIPSVEEVEEALRYLAAIDLVQDRVAGGSIRLYTLHPALRDALLVSLDASAIHRSHLAAKAGFEEILSGHPGSVSPSSRVVLDLLEEVFYHTIEAGRTLEAYNLYQHRFGGYWNLGSRLGEWERGERLCRRLHEATESRRTSEERLPRPVRTMIALDHGRYLIPLGRLDVACACFESANWPVRGGSETVAEMIQYHSGWALFLRGYLAEAGRALEPLVGFGTNDGPILVDALAVRALVHLFRGEVDDAESLRERACDIARSWDKDTTSSRILGYCLATFLARNGSFARAARMGEVVWREARWSEEQDLETVLFLGAVEAHFLAAAGDPDLSRARLAEIESQPRLPELVRCLNAFTRVRLAQIDGQDLQDTGERVTGALSWLDTAIDIARRYGFGILHIDLLIARARFHLLHGDPEAAEHNLLIALYGAKPSSFTVRETARLEENKLSAAAWPKVFIGDPADLQPQDATASPMARGIFPPEESGYPSLLAATHPECGYAWGEADARLLRSVALCHLAGIPVQVPQEGEHGDESGRVNGNVTVSKSRGGTKTSPDKSNLQSAPPGAGASELTGDTLSMPAAPSSEARALVTQAKVELKLCLDLQRRLRDPREKETHRLLDSLALPPGRP